MPETTEKDTKVKEFLRALHEAECMMIHHEFGLMSLQEWSEAMDAIVRLHMAVDAAPLDLNR